MKFDTTITLGNIVHILSLISTVVGASFWMSGQFHALDLRISTLEITLTRLADLDDKLDGIERRVLILEQP